MSEIEFVDSFPVHKRGRVENPIYGEILEALKGNPGVPAKVFSGLLATSQANYRVGKLRDLGLRSASSRVEDGTYEVYAQFEVAEGAEAPAPAEKPARKAPAARKATAAPKAARKPRAKAAAKVDEPSE